MDMEDKIVIEKMNFPNSLLVKQHPVKEGCHQQWHSSNRKI